jgi:hypothetical protein
VQTPYVVALGPDGTYFIACKNSKDAPVWFYSLPKGSRDNIKSWKKGIDTQCKQYRIRLKMRAFLIHIPIIGVISTTSQGDSWKTLQSWISDNFTCDHDALKNSTMVFGTGNTYFTKTPKGCLWNNIPDDLEKTIIDHMSDRGPPSDVCLGVHETWVVFWDNGKIQWNLRSSYDSVHEKLSEDTGDITRLVLDPYSSDFFLHYRNGLVAWSVQFDTKNDTTKNFVQRCQAYMQERAREDGITFELERWTSGGKISKQGYVISPSTKWDLATENSLPGYVLRLLPIPESWSERVRQTAASSGWSTATWSGATLGIFGTAIAFFRKGSRFFRR